MQKSVQRKNRGKLVRVALVGYTNVGKSTLMNLLSKSDVFAENKLFATLDTTVRKVTIGNLPFLLSDTVGFIRKLPTHLIESFKSTLDEVREADILIHIVDISHPAFEEQIEVVEKHSTISIKPKSLRLLFSIKLTPSRMFRKIRMILHPKKEKTTRLMNLNKHGWVN